MDDAIISTGRKATRGLAHRPITMEATPAADARFVRDDEVVLTGLVKKPELNGKTAFVLARYHGQAALVRRLEQLRTPFWRLRRTNAADGILPAYLLTEYGWRLFFARPVWTMWTTSGRIGAWKTPGSLMLFETAPSVCTGKSEMEGTRSDKASMQAVQPQRCGESERSLCPVSPPDHVTLPFLRG